MGGTRSLHENDEMHAKFW